MKGRLRRGLIGFVAGWLIGVGYSLAQDFFVNFDISGYIPQTVYGWVTYYISVGIPWGVVGALIGFFWTKRSGNQ